MYCNQNANASTWIKWKKSLCWIRFHLLCRTKKRNEFIDDIREFDRQFVYLFDSISTEIYINNKSIFDLENKLKFNANICFMCSSVLFSITISFLVICAFCFWLYYYWNDKYEIDNSTLNTKASKFPSHKNKKKLWIVEVDRKYNM